MGWTLVEVSSETAEMAWPPRFGARSNTARRRWYARGLSGATARGSARAGAARSCWRLTCDGQAVGYVNSRGRVGHRSRALEGPRAATRRLVVRGPVRDC